MPLIVRLTYLGSSFPPKTPAGLRRAEAVLFEESAVRRAELVGAAPAGREKGLNTSWQRALPRGASHDDLVDPVGCLWCPCLEDCEQVIARPLVIDRATAVGLAVSALVVVVGAKDLRRWREHKAAADVATAPDERLGGPDDRSRVEFTAARPTPLNQSRVEQPLLVKHVDEHACLQKLC